MGRLLVDEPLAVDCTYTIIGTGTGVPAYQLATPDLSTPTHPTSRGSPGRMTPC